ncbi:uncharacterized protein LOC129809628 [Phlebotomus papatasi]|uniref:uncharacterized protein LOC129809628 n=1 Tax=Phlebotomus papatasi TaxID=29031 RepID=UPI002484702B|nr:uncharacterized protein LOC129809628 [Phlebotomus papatasi]
MNRMSALEKKQCRRMTDIQKAQMWKFMDLHPELNGKKYDKEFTFVKARELWQEMGRILNSVPGPKKSWMVWKKSWRDMQFLRRRMGKETFREIPVEDIQLAAPDPNVEEVVDDAPWIIYKRESSTTLQSQRSREPLFLALDGSPTNNPGNIVKLEIQDAPETPTNPNETSNNESSAQCEKNDVNGKMIEMLERQTVAYENLAHSMRLQSEAFLVLSESISDLASAVRTMKK